MIYDSRGTRAIIIIGLSAAIGAVLGERLVKPMVESLVKK